MKPSLFGYARAESVEDALSLLAQGDAETRVLAGGQSLVPLLNLRMVVALSSIVFLLFFYWIVRREFSTATAVAATAILSTSAGWLAYSFAALTDLPMSATLATSWGTRGCINPPGTRPPRRREGVRPGPADGRPSGCHRSESGPFRAALRGLRHEDILFW